MFNKLLLCISYIFFSSAAFAESYYVTISVPGERLVELKRLFAALEAKNFQKATKIHRAFAPQAAFMLRIGMSKPLSKKDRGEELIETTINGEERALLWIQKQKGTVWYLYTPYTAYDEGYANGQRALSMEPYGIIDLGAGVIKVEEDTEQLYRLLPNLDPFKGKSYSPAIKFNMEDLKKIKRKIHK